MKSGGIVMSDGLVTDECFLVGDRLRVYECHFGDRCGVAINGSDHRMLEATVGWQATGDSRRAPCGDVRDGTALLPWFYRVLRNGIVDHRRRNGCRDRWWCDLGLCHDRWCADRDQWRGDGDRSLGDGGRGAGWRTARRKQVVGDAIVLGRYPPPADFDPEIVTASCRDDREMLAGNSGAAGNRMNGAEFVKRALQLHRQELTHDPIHRVERQATARQLDLTRRRDDVRLFAGVHHQRFAVDLQNRLQ
jgi:hypothetical protein